MKSFKDISTGGLYVLIDYTTKEILEMLKEKDDEPQMYLPLSDHTEEISSLLFHYIDVKNLVFSSSNCIWDNLHNGYIEEFKIKHPEGKIIVFDGLTEMMYDAYDGRNTSIRFEDGLSNYDYLRQTSKCAKKNDVNVFITSSDEAWTDYLNKYCDLFKSVIRKS